MGTRRARSVLVTGAAGTVGRLFLRRLAATESPPATIVAVDVRDVPPGERLAGVHYHRADVRSPELAERMRDQAVDTVVHLAFVVTPGRGDTREQAYAIDVLGTENVLASCAKAGVGKLIVTSSGAAYGYHPDNPVPLRETDPLRGNEAFAYSHHKRLVEERLAAFRVEHPEIAQLVLRVCTVLGPAVSNQITAMFERPVVLDVGGATAPFVFVWDEDLIACLVHGVGSDRSGVYNVAGDGSLSMAEIARILGKRRVAVPAPLLRGALALLSRLGMSPYGPEQVLFLQHRPVLSNAKLKAEFGVAPRLGSEEAFRRYAAAKGMIRGE